MVTPKQTAIITGSSRGIGAATFRRMDLMPSSNTLAGPRMLKSSELLKDSPQEVLDHLAEMTPLRDGEWINGQTIRVNGGII